MKLPLWTKPIERFVNHSIPWILVLLTLIIIVDFTPLAAEYHLWLVIGDYFVIAFFVADLFFKWFHVRKIGKFIRLYWIDILAVFPFYVFFRFYGVLREAVSAGEEVQKIVHEAQLAKEARLLREYESVARFAKETRFLRAGVRFLRLLRLRWYLTHLHLHIASRKITVSK